MVIDQVLERSRDSQQGGKLYSGALTARGPHFAPAQLLG